MKIDSRLTFNKVRYDQDTDAHLVLTLTAPAVNADKVRPKLALVMCIDTSSSMAGPKLDFAKKSVLKMIEHLRNDDVFGVVTFDSQVRVIAEPKKLEGRKDEMRKAVSNLGTSGMTNFSGGMLKSIDLLKNLDLGGNYIHRVIMFTDGQANCGPAKEPADIIKLFKANSDMLISASAFGYGTGSGDFSPDFLADFAKEAKGNYAHIEDPDKALQAFGTELGGLVSTYATDLSIEVKPLNGHIVQSVLSDVDVDEENTGEVMIKVPDLLAEETRHLVVAVKLSKQKVHGPRAVNVFDVKASYQTFDAQGKKETHTEEAKGRIQFVKDGDEDKKPDEKLDDIVGLAQLAHAQVEAEEAARKGDYEKASRRMEDQAKSFTSRGRSRLAAASNSLGGKMASAAAYSANNGYLRSFERGMSRGMGVSSYSAGADYDLQELGVQTSTTSSASTAASFTGGAIVNQPNTVWTIDHSQVPAGGLVWSGDAVVVPRVTAPTPDPDEARQQILDAMQASVQNSVPEPETNKSDAKSPKGKSSKSSRKPIKQTRSKQSW